MECRVDVGRCEGRRGTVFADTVPMGVRQIQTSERDSAGRGNSEESKAYGEALVVRLPLEYLILISIENFSGVVRIELVRFLFQGIRRYF